MHPLKTLFSSPADDWIVIAKQLCVGALKALRDQRLEQGLDPPQQMQVVKVNLLKTETSWSTRVAIAGQKQAIDLDISAVPPSEAADNLLLLLRDSPAGDCKGRHSLNNPESRGRRCLDSTTGFR